MVKVCASVLGGLPVIAEVWFSGPDHNGEYDAGVDQLFWQKRDGTCGAPLSQKVMDRVEREDYWEADVTEQANDWLSFHCPIRRYDHTSRTYIDEGEYSEEYLKLNRKG